MAVPAYAAVVSVMHVLDQIPVMHMLHLDGNQIQILQENVSFFQGFLEDRSQIFHEDVEYLATQIVAVASEAEDIIDTHVVDQLISQRSEDESYMDLSSFCKDIDRVIKKMDVIRKELMMFKERMTVQEQQHRVSVHACLSATRSSGKNTMVGFDEQLIRIMDELTGYRSDLQILPIVGMGGIGKTTLARNVFENSLIKYHFHVRLWVTISQGYSIDGILLGLLQDMGICQKDKESGEDFAKLGEKLYKSLSGRKYLIVLDDVWSSDVWNDIKLFFPDNKNGSRIMMTTRLSSVAVSLGCHNPYFMDFLDEDQSWNLFCEEAFTEDCPPELEEIGKKIARSCRGLPLAIVVIGGLLSNSNMTRQYWEIVAENVSSFGNSGNDEHCLKILSLSYNHLPIHLKPCFLYMRVFPGDVGIKVSELIKLWVAEGFLKPIRSKTLEEVAEEYLENLIDRNLIQISNWALSGKIKTCSIHDFLRDLCLRESGKEHFYFVAKVQWVNFPDDLSKCFLCGNPKATNMSLSQIHDISQPTSIASCFVCEACRIINPQLDRSRMVRAIDMPLEGYLQPTKLRYLNLSCTSGDFVFVSTLLPLLWNLQTLIFSPFFNFSLRQIVLPSEIWEMPQLRHVIIDKAVLVDPPDGKGSTTILENLLTLSSIKNFRCSKDVLERIPNLKKLRIEYDIDCVKGAEWSYYSLHNLVHLRRLESLFLKCETFILKEMTFPHSLKKLCLSQCKIAREEMTIIGSLPNLEVLKFDFCTFEEAEWNPVEGEFLRLKSLTMHFTNLKYWRVEKIHFPRLESLELRWMFNLETIPSEIGEIETLRLIRLVGCHESTVSSAEEILEEQRSLGNEILQLDTSFASLLVDLLSDDD